jgi:TRAP-type C4-dicarboxylate transport system permease small subunit
MGRLILILLAVFAAPAVAWFAWRWLQRPAKQAEPAPPLRWQDAPWMWLVLIGLALSVAAVLGFGVWEQRDCQPVPTQVIDGKLVPAHCD